MMFWIAAIILLLFLYGMWLEAYPSKEEQRHNEAQQQRRKELWDEQQKKRQAYWSVGGEREQAQKNIIRLELQSQQSYDLEQRVLFKFQADQLRERIARADEWHGGYPPSISGYIRK